MSKKKKTKSPVSTDPVSARASTQPHSFPIKHVLVVSLMAVLTLMAYANTFSVPFHFDDDPNIVFNASTHLKTLSLPWVIQLIRANYKESLRIFAYFTFALNYYVGGLQVFGYHLVNLLIHLSCGILLYAFILLTLNLPSLKDRYGSKAFPIALFSGLLFLVHPIQTQSVTYIVQRMASMAAMFYLLAMVLYVKGRLASGVKRYLYLAGMVLSYLLGLFTKENVAILPLFIALYEFYFFQNLEVSRKGNRALLYAAGSVLFIGLLMVLLLGRRYVDGIIEGYAIRDFTLTERVLTQFRVVLYYVTLLVWPLPSRLNLDYDFPTSHGVLDPATTLLSILIVVGLIVYSIWKAKKHPLASFFILWYFGNLVIESSIFPLEMVYEHRLYLPAIGPIVLCVVFVLTAWERTRTRATKSSEFGVRSSEQKAATLDITDGNLTRTRITDTDTIIWCFFLAVAVLMVWGSYERNKVWRDPLTLWQDCLKKSPNKPRSHTNYGFYLVQDGKIDRGVEEYKIALKLNPKFEDAHFNLAQVYGERRLFDQAEVHLKECIRLAPKDPRGYNEMGLIRLQKNRFNEAIQFFKKALEMKPSLEIIHANLGNAYLQINQIDEAMAEYKSALQLNPELPDVYVKTSEIYRKKGAPELAAEELKKALKINPSFYEVHLLRGATYLQEGKVDDAIGEFNQALKYNSIDSRIYNNLGIAYRKKGMADEAIRQYKKALALDPSFSDAHSNLAEIYLGKGMTDEAILELREALRLGPDKAEVHNNLGVIFLRKKNLDGAISSFKNALAIEPNYGEAYFNLAVAYYYKKDAAAASSHARKALDLGYPVDARLLKALRISP